MVTELAEEQEERETLRPLMRTAPDSLPIRSRSARASPVTAHIRCWWWQTGEPAALERAQTKAQRLLQLLGQGK